MQSRRSFLKKFAVAIGAVAAAPLLPALAEQEAQLEVTELAESLTTLKPMTTGSASGWMGNYQGVVWRKDI
jgi:hypothetical protein